MQFGSRLEAEILQYSYEALDQNNLLIKGEIESADEREAYRLLTDKGLVIVDIVATKVASNGRAGKLSESEVCISLFEFTTLLDSGVTVAESVESMRASDAHPILMAFYNHVAQQLQHGASLAKAASSSKLTLPAYVLQLIEAGETSGKLALSMRSAVSQMEYDLSVANDLRNALIYPAILVASGIAAVGLIFIFVVPKFANLLAGKTDLPLLAYTVISTGVWLNTYFLYVFIALVIILMLLVSQLSKKSVRDNLLDRSSTLPVIGQWLADSDIARWASVMAAMLISRVEMVKALGLAQKSVRSIRRQKALARVTRAVQSGGDLSKALIDHQILAPTAYNLIKAGEKSGKLAEMMQAVARIYDNSSRNRMKKVLLLIEPLAIVVIGVMIAVIIIGVVQAITSVNDIAI